MNVFKISISLDTFIKTSITISEACLILCFPFTVADFFSNHKSFNIIEKH